MARLAPLWWVTRTPSAAVSTAGSEWRSTSSTHWGKADAGPLPTLLQNSHRLVAWALEQGGREAQDALVEQLFKVLSPPATILLQHCAVLSLVLPVGVSSSLHHHNALPSLKMILASLPNVACVRAAGLLHSGTPMVNSSPQLYSCTAAHEFHVRDSHTPCIVPGTRWRARRSDGCWPC